MEDWSSFVPHPALLLYFLVIFPTAIVAGGSADAMQFEFNAFRLQQYDLASNAYGEIFLN